MYATPPRPPTTAEEGSFRSVSDYLSMYPSICGRWCNALAATLRRRPVCRAVSAAPPTECRVVEPPPVSRLRRVSLRTVNVSCLS
ncbi:hypothetical protein CSUI_005665 [Cystoisospora suis]|uniref:Uncharacterized protein n=1 Tax=Cystoisospora suis TaxID=483139 RepID=A0A2C6KW98_9APIC|nr:hypothetical protein CSUI_005665 [Cystoisospora suis]